MTFSDLSEFCRLCLLPLNGSYIDCALKDHVELKDTIKMVYRIDVWQTYFLIACSLILLHRIKSNILIIVVVVVVVY